MEITVNLELLAKDAVRAVSRGDIPVIIDVFRCCSTVITALKNGAKGIIPVETLSDALRLHREHPDWLLAGERKARRPKGFHLGNSPMDFTRSRVEGRYVIITTTDGTKAIRNTEGAEPKLIGAFLNASSVAEAALEIAEKEKRGITLIASGIRGKISLEDFLCAGKIAQLMEGGGISFSDSALSALLASRGAGEAITEIIQRSSHAEYLKGVGFGRDVEYCSKLDTYDVVPVISEGIAVLN